MCASDPDKNVFPDIDFCDGVEVAPTANNYHKLQWKLEENKTFMVGEIVLRKVIPLSSSYLHNIIQSTVLVLEILVEYTFSLTKDPLQVLYFNDTLLMKFAIPHVECDKSKPRYKIDSFSFVGGSDIYTPQKCVVTNSA